MRRVSAFVFLTALVLAPNHSHADPGAGWDLAWYDVFADDGNTLNQRKWGALTEKKLYREGCWSPAEDIRTELFASKVTVGPYLTITATKKAAPTFLSTTRCDNGNPWSAQFDYDSGYASGKSWFRYGFYEISIRSKRVSGTWPYFLLLGDNDCPGNAFTEEMDIYEQFDFSSKLQSTIHGHATSNCATEDSAWCDFANCTSGGNKLYGCACSPTPIDIENNFYVYQFNWTATTEILTFKPEAGPAIGTLGVLTPDNHRDFARVHYALYARNYAPAPDPTKFPVTMDLKYLKIWKNDLYCGGQFENTDGAPWSTATHGAWTTSAVSGGTPQACASALPGSSPGLCWMPSTGAVGPQHLRSVYSGSAGTGGKVCLPNLPTTPNATYFSDKAKVILAGDLRTVNAQTNVLVEYRTRSSGVWSGPTTFTLHVPTNGPWEPVGDLDLFHSYLKNQVALDFTKAAGMDQLSICFTFTTAGSSGCGSSDAIMDLDNIAVYGDPS